MLKIKQSLLFAVGFLTTAFLCWLMLGGFIEAAGSRLVLWVRTDSQSMLDLVLVFMPVALCIRGGNILVAMFDNLNKPDTRSQSGETASC